MRMDSLRLTENVAERFTKTGSFTKIESFTKLECFTNTSTLKWTLGLLSASLLWFATASAAWGQSSAGRFSYSSPPESYVHALLGQSRPEASGWDGSRSTGSAINHLGLAIQFPYHDGTLQYGAEFKLNLGYSNSHKVWLPDSRYMDSELKLGDMALGAFVGVKPNDWLRLYAAGGPALYWGWLRGHYNNYTIENQNMNVGRPDYDGSGATSGAQIGYYLRSGVEFTVSRQSTFGFSVLYTDAELSFGGGRHVNLATPTYALTLGYRF